MDKKRILECFFTKDSDISHPAAGYILLEYTKLTGALL